MTRTETVIHFITIGSLTAIAGAQLPSFEVSSSYRSGQVLSGGFGIINSVFFFPDGDDGVIGLDVTNDGEIFAQVQVLASAYEDAALYTPFGFSPVLEADNEFFFSGSCGSNVPCEFHIMQELYWTDINNNGDRVYVMDLEAIGPGASDASGVFWDTSHAIVLEGGPIAATGLAGGATVETVDQNTFVELNDANQLLVSLDVNESGAVNRALVRFDLDSGGQVTGATAIAKAGGPVGAGPATWTELGFGVNAQAINDSGGVLFSGRSSDGTGGFYLDGAFHATENGPAPGGLLWDSLVGQPADLSNNNVSAFRGILRAGNPNTWDEQGDAGDQRPSANTTFGSGSVDLISGTMIDEHDIDLYLIRIEDPASFSATTLPVSGSNGAAFDTVLYLFEPTHNYNGVSRTGLTRNNDTAPGVVQSTITGQHIPVGDGNYGPNYLLAISTNKASAQSNDINAISEAPEPAELWNSTPRDLLVNDGVLYWQDPTAGVIRRVDTATASPMSDLTVSGVPNHPVLPGDQLLLPGLTVDPGASKLYYHDTATTSNRVERANLDGSGQEAVIDSDTNPFEVWIGDMSDLFYDAANDMLYLTDFQLGEVWRTDADGGDVTAIFDEPIFSGGSLSFDEIVVDSTASKIYWSNPITGDLDRSNLDGTGVETVVAGADAAELALDLTGRRLFWTQPDAGRIMTLDLTSDTTSIEGDNLSSPLGLAFDAATDSLFWSSRLSGDIFHRPLTGTPIGTPWFETDDTAERTADGPAWNENVHGAEWVLDGDVGAFNLPYEIKLTGATFSAQTAAISRGNFQYVARAGLAAAQVGSDNTPVRISDSGAVVWEGRSDDGTRGVYYNGDLLYSGDTPVPDLPAGVFHGTAIGPNTLDMSEDGGHVVLHAFNGSFNPPPGYSPGDITILIEITSTPPCNAADLAEPFAILDLDDISAFILGFTGQAPIADLAAPFGVFDLADITAFLTAFLAGCP